MSNYESIQSIEVSAAQRSLQYERGKIARYEDDIEDAENHIVELSLYERASLQDLDYWEKVWDHPDFSFALNNLLLGSSKSTKAYLRHFEKVYERAKNEHALSLKNLEKCEVRIANLKEELSLSGFKVKRLEKRIPAPLYRDTLNQQLSNNEFYVRNSLRFREAHWSNTIKITFALQEMQAKVPWCYDQVQQAIYTKAVITIPSMLVDFEIERDGSVKVVLRARSGSERYTGMASKLLLHPHMTDPTVPCLGDFAAPIIELVSDGQIFDAVTVLAMFLQQVYPPDAAGQYWYNWPILEQEYSLHNPDDPEARVFERDEEEAA